MYKSNTFKSFRNGYMQLRQADAESFRNDFMSEFNCVYATFLSRLNGKIDMKLSQVEKINELFAKYGITENIWS